MRSNVIFALVRFRVGALLLGLFFSPLTVVAQGPTFGTSMRGAPPMSAPQPQDILFPRGAYDARGLTPDEAINVSVYEFCNRGVVNISTAGVPAGRFLMMPLEGEGSGSGAVLDKQGHILTNYHVIAGARQINVTLFNEETVSAKLIGADPVNDIAVLKIDAPEDQLFPLTLGDSDQLKVGMRVFALGNPFGLERSMSQGMISSLNRTLEIQKNWVIKSIIQIDASINPGNSGGPLIDSKGNLIGINTAIASRVEQSAGIGFAIPVNLVRRIFPELIQYGKVIRGDIGITHVTVVEKGLRVARMTPGGPAERAGIKGPDMIRRGLVTIIDRSVADVIVAVDGNPVATAAEFLGFIESKKPGNVVELSVLRADKVIKVNVTLGGEQSGPDGLKL
ncbi:S1C family serine protease [Planctomicrobium sp. SH664]|uniref:S1C family serine protease n=1 Tax=Planctomicrobium sp. SH664 TaxID=3448125 RepID=UPI003F5B6EB4